MRVRMPLSAMLAILLIHAPAVRAEIQIVDSLEWLAIDAPLIVQAKVTDISESRGRYQVVYRDMKLSDVKILKGDTKPENIALRLRVVGDDKLGLAWKSSGDTYVFFLQPGKNELDSDMGGHSVLRSNPINLDRPTRVFTAAMKEATDREEILKTIATFKDKRAGAEPVGEPNMFKPQLGYVRLEIPFGSPIFQQVFGGSTCYINVPADEKTHATAVKMSGSDSVTDRISAAGMLLNYPGPETTKILTAMLADTATSRTYQNSQLIRINFPVRSEAYNTLLQLGEKPEKPLLERPPTQIEIDAEKSPKAGP